MVTSDSLKVAFLCAGVGALFAGVITMSAILVCSGVALIVLLGVTEDTQTDELCAKPTKPKPTKLDGLIEEYLKRDPLDPSSTITFLTETAELADPFAEAPVVPPVRIDQGTDYSDFETKLIRDKVAGAYGLPPTAMRVCSFCGDKPCEEGHAPGIPVPCPKCEIVRQGSWNVFIGAHAGKALTIGTTPIMVPPETGRSEIRG